MTIPRFCCQHTALCPDFRSASQTGWQIFDRESTSPQGEALSIAFCRSARHARTIRDALNADQRTSDAIQ